METHSSSQLHKQQIFVQVMSELIKTKQIKYLNDH
jgi:hypothetical protein